MVFLFLQVRKLFLNNGNIPTWPWIKRCDSAIQIYIIIYTMKTACLWFMYILAIESTFSPFVNARARDDVVHSTSFLDSAYIRTLVRNVRNMILRIVGGTGERMEGPFFLDENMEFPCAIKNRRSPQIPTSVHRLRPGEI